MAHCAGRHRIMVRRCAAVVCAVAVTSQQASAHMVIEGVGGFYGGFLHPILNPVHMLALGALGLFAGQQRGPLLPMAVFALGVTIGLFAIALGTGATPSETILSTMTIVLGLLVAFAWMPPTLVSAPLVAAAGLSLGLDSPPQAITIAEGNEMLVGTALGACLALGLVALASSLATPKPAKLGVRISGLLIAAAATLLLATAFA